MAKINLERFLKIHKSIIIDTCIFIYQFENHPKFSKLTHKIFTHLEKKNSVGYISTISLLEILIKPKKEKQYPLALQYKFLLAESSYLKMVDITVKIADLAADVRAKYNLSTPDSIIIATGLYQTATGLITANKRLAKVKEIDVFVLK